MYVSAVLTRPLPPRDRTVTPYAGEPADLSPYAKFAAPYNVNYTHPNIYSGAARDLPDPARPGPRCDPGGVPPRRLRRGTAPGTRAARRCR